MTRTRTHSVVAFAALMACAIACARDTQSYTGRQRPVILMEQFPSYISESELASRFTAAPLRTVVRENLARSSVAPAFRIVDQTAAPYSHLGFSGGLMFEFQNDRLASVWFFTQDIDGYVAALKRNGVDLQTGRNLTVVAHVDGRGRRAVVWHDTRLMRERARWVERYSR